MYWNRLRAYLKAQYGTTVYKLALSSGCSCPNRDGTLGTRGCIFCDGAGAFAQHGPIPDQLAAAKARVAFKAGPNARYIAYFQSFTNTYAPLSRLRELYTAAMAPEDVVILSVATRPDCLPEETVDLLAEKLNVKLNKVKFKSAYNIVRFGGQKCLVMKPQTYMNLSGEAVREAVQFYKIPADHVLVIYDDVSLPVGKLRVRPTGSAGGHNGIKNIIAHLGTQDFPRIKIGTGAPAGGGAEMIDWVIGVPSQAERKILVESFERAIQAAEDILENGCQKAMNDYN